MNGLDVNRLLIGSIKLRQKKYFKIFILVVLIFFNFRYETPIHSSESSLLSQHSDHDHHGSEDSPSHDLLWENCPLGALADTATFIPSFNFFIPQLQFTSKTAVAHASSSSSFFLGFKSRAPPFLRRLS